MIAVLRSLASTAALCVGVVAVLGGGGCEDSGPAMSAEPREPVSMVVSAEHGGGYTGIMIRDGEVIVVDTPRLPDGTAADRSFFCRVVEDGMKQPVSERLTGIPLWLESVANAHLVDRGDFEGAEYELMHQQFVVSLGDTVYVVQGECDPRYHNELVELYSEKKYHKDGRVQLEHMTIGQIGGQRVELSSGLVLLTAPHRFLPIDVKADSVRLSDADHVWGSRGGNVYTARLEEYLLEQELLAEQELKPRPAGGEVLLVSRDPDLLWIEEERERMVSSAYRIDLVRGQHWGERSSASDEYIVVVKDPMRGGEAVSILDRQTGAYLGSVVLGEGCGIDDLSYPLVVGDWVFIENTDSLVVFRIEREVIESGGEIQALYFE